MTRFLDKMSLYQTKIPLQSYCVTLVECCHFSRRKHKNTWAGNSRWLFISVGIEPNFYIYINGIRKYSKRTWVIFDLNPNSIKKRRCTEKKKAFRLTGSRLHNRSDNVIWLSYRGDISLQLSFASRELSMCTYKYTASHQFNSFLFF